MKIAMVNPGVVREVGERWGGGGLSYENLGEGFGSRVFRTIQRIFSTCSRKTQSFNRDARCTDIYMA